MNETLKEKIEKALDDADDAMQSTELNEFGFNALSKVVDMLEEILEYVNFVSS